MSPMYFCFKCRIEGQYPLIPPHEWKDHQRRYHRPGGERRRQVMMHHDRDVQPGGVRPLWDTAGVEDRRGR